MKTRVFYRKLSCFMKSNFLLVRHLFILTEFLFGKKNRINSLVSFESECKRWKTWTLGKPEKRIKVAEDDEGYWMEVGRACQVEKERTFFCILPYSDIYFTFRIEDLSHISLMIYIWCEIKIHLSSEESKSIFATGMFFLCKSPVGYLHFWKKLQAPKLIAHCNCKLQTG